MSVHYKFKSAVEYDTLPVDGLHISLADLKDSIIQQKRLGKGQPYDLRITNAETKEVYTDDKVLIPKNTSLIVARIPIDPSQMKRPWESKDATALILSNPSNLMNTEDAAEAAEIDRKIKEVTDLTRMKGSEQDKINAMVAQSTMDYHPSKYVKLRASKMTGVVPLGYKCYKCNKSGHWVTMCPLNNQDLRKSTGIPTMFLEEANDPSAPGVMITQSGRLVRLRDMGGDTTTANLPPVEKRPPPEDLQCKLCREILKDAVLIPCCAEAYCDECIRNHLLDSEDHVCPDCGKSGIGPDGLIPNRYLRIRVQEFECGWLLGDKKADVSSDGGEALSPIPSNINSQVSPTPPCSPARLGASPARIRISSNLLKSPSSQVASPIAERSPLRANVVDCIGNGDLPPSTEKPVPVTEEKGNAGSEIRDASGDFDTLEEQMENDEMLPDEKENVELKDCDTSIDEKQKKTKKRKGKRKNSRHESEEEKEEKKRKKREKSHKSQDKKSLEKKSKRHSSEQLKDVEDLPDDRSDHWDDAIVESKVSHDSEEEGERRRRPHAKEPLSERLEDDGPPGDDWNEKRKDSIRERSRSNSEDDNVNDKVSTFVPFNPHVPPPNFVKSPPQGYQYSVTSAYVPQVTRPVPVTSDTTYPHYQPGLIADPLTEFERHMREKDERNRKWRHSRSRSPSRSPRYRRARSRSRQRSWSHSRSRSTSRSRLGPSVRSPRSQSRRWWSRSPPPRGHTYRSRSPSYSRERSVSNRSLSLSRTPSPNRRVGSSPLRVLPHVHPDPLALTRPPMNYMPGDINRYQVPTVPHDQYQYQPPPHQTPMPPVTGPWEQPPPRYNQGRPETMRPFRGRRGRGGFRGQNFDHRGGHDYRYQDFRGQRMMDDRRVMQGSVGWDRDVRQNFNTELPRVDRNGRPYDSDRRRFGDVNDYDDGRNRRYDGPNSYSDEEWRYSDDGRKRDEEFENRRYEGRRGRDDRKEEPDFRKGSDEDYDDYKRSRREGDRGRSYDDRSYKDIDDGRSNRHEREGKNRDLSSRRDSPRDDDLHYHSKSYDSPGKSHKKTPPKDRRDKDSDRRERDSDRRERDYDKRDMDSDKRDRDSDGRRDRDSDSRRDRDGDRRERDSDKKERSKSYRRDRDDRRDRDSGRQEGDRKEKISDRKDSYKRDKDQDRKLHDDDRKDKEGDRKERDSTKHERESTNRDKSDRNGEEDRRERTYISRWDHADAKVKPEKGIEKDGKSHEVEPSHTQEEKEHKRKSRRKEDKDESHHGKDKGESTQEGESSLKAEKKKHDKKKRKKEKRRASQASTEASQGEMSGDDGEDKKKKKKREKKKKSKGTSAEGVEDPDEKVAGEKSSESDPKDSGNKEMPGSYVEHDSEVAVREGTPEPKPNAESSMAQLPMPPLSKWERDEDITLTPKGLSENKAPEEENKDKVTVDILKRAENTIFAGRGLVTRKVFLDPQKQKEGEEKERSPTPEWERLELREAKRRGPSIQITISSKTESQIGRPRGGGRYQPSSPEHGDDKRYSLRSRRGSETDKPEKHLRSQKRSQSPAEAQGISKTRRKSEKEQVKVEKDNDINKDQSSSSDFTATEDKVKDSTDAKPLLDKDFEKQDFDNLQDSAHKMEVDESKLKQTESLQDRKPDSIVDETKDEEPSPPRGVKRPSPSGDELEIKKVKVDDDDDPSVSGLGGITDTGKTVSPSEREKHHVQEHDNSKSMYHDSGKEIKVHKPVMQNFNSNLVTIPLISGEPEELEEGEIPSDYDDNATLVNEVVVGRPKEINNMEPNELLEGMPVKRYSPIRVPSPVNEQHNEPKELIKVKEKSKKRKKRKKSSSSSSSDSSSSSSSSSSSDEEEISKKKKKKKKKKKAAVLSESSDGESQKKHKKKKKEKKKKKKKSKKKSDK